MNIWWTLAVAGVALLAGAYKAAQSLVVAIKDYTVTSVDLTNGFITMRLNLVVKNPLAFGTRINSISGDVYAQGKQIGVVDDVINYYVAGKRTHIIPVNVTMNLDNMGAAMMANIESGSIRTLTVDFDGMLNVGSANIGVPLQLSLKYSDLFK